MPPVQHAVWGFIAQGGSETGCAVRDILPALRESHAEADVTEALDHLMAAGRIYPTIDDDHFQVMNDDGHVVMPATESAQAGPDPAQRVSPHPSRVESVMTIGIADRSVE